jgi:CheY-like chemotaxis protein
MRIIVWRVQRRRRYGVGPHGKDILTTAISVLVVEDEPVIRMSLVLYLGDEGFDVFEAGSADEAIGILEAQPKIQAVFTDVDMPGSMDGLKLAAAVRDRWPPIKIIVTSGYKRPGLSELPERSFFLPKPYQFASVARSLRNSVLSA